MLSTITTVNPIISLKSNEGCYGVKIYLVSVPVSTSQIIVYFFSKCLFDPTILPTISNISPA